MRSALSAPGFEVAGVSVPGLPGILIGHNARIAWSLTDTQDQATLFYDEKTLRGRPGQYFWDGRWRPMQVVRYTIPVRGAATRHADRGPYRPRADHDSGRADHLGRLDGQRGFARPGRAARHQPGRELRPVQERPSQLDAPTQNFVYADAGEHRRDLGGLLSPGRRGLPAVAADERHRRMRRDRRHPLLSRTPGLRPARPRPGHRQPATSHRGLPLLRRHQRQLLRPGLPCRHHLRRAARRTTDRRQLRHGPEQPGRSTRCEHRPSPAARPARCVSFFFRTVRGVSPGRPGTPPWRPIRRRPRSGGHSGATT